MDPHVAQAAKTDGLLPPKIAKEVPGQSTWKTLGLEDLRGMQPTGTTPELLAQGQDMEDAVNVLRQALGVFPDGLRLVETPAGKVLIADQLLPHVVEKRGNARERYGNFVLPTLQQPDEIWATQYDDASVRRRYIKLFAGAKYDILVIVREGSDGAVLWNVINRERKGMNAMRIGTLVYQRTAMEGG